eukprot:6778761-Alexandrium_andersonii.AAC.1
MDEQEVARRAAAARTHLEFTTKLYWPQLERGAYFLHEHPPRRRHGRSHAWWSCCASPRWRVALGC